MSSFGSPSCARVAAGLLLTAAAGCAWAPPQTAVSTPAAPAVNVAPCVQVSYSEPAAASADAAAVAPLPPGVDADDPFAGQGELSAGQLVAEVQARNPSLSAMVSAWQAAAQRYPQVVSLEDPMFTFMRGMPDGWMVEAGQKIPWPGKRALRGCAANAEANAAGHDVDDTRLRLTEAARLAYADYYLAVCHRRLNHTTAGLLEELRRIATAKYEANQVFQQDVLQVTVEAGDVESMDAGLRRDEEVAVARINTLLHRRADHPLPPPPRELALPGGLPPPEGLQALALGRPDLQAAAARAQEEEANLALACKEYYPDLEIVARYDAFMPADMQSQVGMNLNVPLWQTKRNAAVCEAQARLQQRRFEYQDLLDQVRFEVQSACASSAKRSEHGPLSRQDSAGRGGQRAIGPGQLRGRSLRLPAAHRSPAAMVPGAAALPGRRGRRLPPRGSTGTGRGRLPPGKRALVRRPPGQAA